MAVVPDATQTERFGCMHGFVAHGFAETQPPRPSSRRPASHEHVTAPEATLHTVLPG